MAKPIYVEIHIRAPLDEVWRLTQTPDLHARWDLRFTDIEYLPRPDESAPQRFLYTTRIGFGMAISGTGSSVGSHDGANGRTSSLRFESDDPKSLIESGSGYWQYQPTSDGVRFLTQYGYDVRFGRLGRWFDRLVFRPLLGWATAWSFDRLRLWLEAGIDPATSMQRSVVHAISRTSLALIWIYQGFIPKLLLPDSGELEILRGSAETVVAGIGVAQIAFGLLILLLWDRRGLFNVNIGALIILAAGAAISEPSIFVEPFNPVTLTMAMIALALAGLLSSRDIPSARRCLRTKSGKNS